MAKRKLVEVALPLDAINIACKADKDRKTGTIRNLHKWFAPMPLPAWRALLFATLVDDPGDEIERDRLMRLIERLVAAGGDLPDKETLAAARAEIERAWPLGAPTVMDPFCGAGSTLIEALRLGCGALGSDLNPVPALISRTLVELLPRVAGQPSIRAADTRMAVVGAPFEGLIADTTAYADLVLHRASSRLRHAYPSMPEGSVIAWIWCRTVVCPNPACRAEAPLIDNTILSKKRGGERQVKVDFDVERRPVFSIHRGLELPLTSTVERTGATCAACSSAIPFPYIRGEGREGRLGQRLMAIVVEGDDGRKILPPDPLHEAVALSVEDPDADLDVPLAKNGRDIKPTLYGATTHGDLYTRRQQRLLDVFAQEVARVSDDITADGGDHARCAAIMAVLGLSLGKLAQASSTHVRWKLDSRSGGGKVEGALGEHTLSMTWDFAEANALEDVAGSWTQVVRTAVRALPYAPTTSGRVVMQDARKASVGSPRKVLTATDPPYFGQIAYADLSDYFYVWLRRALRDIFPDLFATVATPKDDELIALPSRHNGDKLAARDAYVHGFTETFMRLAAVQVDDAPMLVVYAFREQKGDSDGGQIAPGWEAILEAMVAARLMIVGTWPIHGTGSTRMISMGANSLATYVVLASRPRPDGAPRITRSDLARLLRTSLARAVSELQAANIAPVDLAQAVIGPGMEVYSRHAAVIETDGSRVGVAQALALINRTLAEILDEQEGDLDPDSRWAVTWYDDHGFDTASFGKADQLARAKGIAVDSLVEAGIVTSGGGRASLIPRDRLRPEWDPATDRRATAWEAVQYLVRSLDESGERGAAELYARLGALADPARELTYRLFQVAEKKGRTDEAIAYNGLVTSWSEIARLADDLAEQPTATPAAEALF